MTWDATWMVASFQSTIDPFIQIFPVPANAIVQRLYAYWRSEQKGHTSARAGRALPHFQQNRAWTVSRALRRVWISCNSSEGPVAATGAGRHGRLMVAGAGVRAASTASSRSDAR